MNFLAGLAGLAGTIAGRVLLALGFSVLTVTGVDYSIDAAKQAIISNLAGAPLAWVQLAGLYGVWEGIGIVFGACTFALSYWSLTKMVSIVGLRHA